MSKIYRPVIPIWIEGDDMRLIDADALIAEMHNITLEDGEDRRTFYEAIERQPTADAVEVKHGEWKRRLVDNGFNADWVCSECGYRVKTDFVSFNYCPNCGAKMERSE